MSSLHTRPTKALAFIAALLFALTMTACGSEDDADPDPVCEPVRPKNTTTDSFPSEAPDGVALVVANTANNPIPSLSGSTRQVLTKAMEGKHVPTLWSATAKPARLDVDLLPLSDSFSPKKNETRIRSNLELIATAVTAPPSGSGLSLFEALSVASDQLKSEDAERPWIIIIGSGLDSDGDLATTDGLLEESPEDVAELVRENNPHLDLAGFNVVMQSFGYVVEPQEAPDTAQRGVIRDIWTTTLTTLDAKVSLDPAPAASCSIDTNQPVEPTSMPGVKVSSCEAEEVILTVPSSVMFEGDSSIVREGSDEALKVPFNVLRDTPDATVEVVGHTPSSSRYTAEELVELSELRAQAVAEVFIDRGIEARRITTRGVGDADPLGEHIDENGLQTEAAAAERRVEVIINGVTECPEI